MTEVAIYCGCGKKHVVTEGAADSTLACSCGRDVRVPRLRELRRLAGESSAPSPELRLEHFLTTEPVELGRHCSHCGAPTDGRIEVVVECERSWTKSGDGGFWTHFLGYLFLGWIGLILVRANRTPDRQFGADKIYHLPLRVCGHCQPLLKDFSVARDCLMQTPVYGDLLDKFPNAVIKAD